MTSGEDLQSKQAMRLQSIFSKTMELSKLTVGRSGFRRSGLRAVPVRSQRSTESMLEPSKDPFDEADLEDDGRRSPAALKKLKFSRTLIHSMKIGGNKDTHLNIGYTEQGLEVLDIRPSHSSPQFKEWDQILKEDKSDVKSRRRAVLFPGMTDNEVDKKFVKVCNSNTSWRKFVKAYKKVRKAGVDTIDLDTMLRGLLHPSDYREIIHQVAVEPKVTIGDRCISATEVEDT